MNAELDWHTWDWDPEAVDPGTDPDPDEQVPASLRMEVPGELVWNDSGAVYVHTCAYPLASKLQHLSFADHGATHLDVLQDIADTGNSLIRQTLHDCAFVDCETTGLGRTSVPFMVGMATYEHLADLSLYAPLPRPNGSALFTAHTLSPPDQATPAPPTHLVVRQLFALHPGEEGALLEALQDLVAAYPICVTFNGRSFDIPLLQYRYQYHLIRFPELPLADPFGDEGPFSLDLLPMARKLWRRRIGSCALTNCEVQVLGRQRTHADVHGAQIPGIYRQFLDTGQARALSRVFYHNRQDIISMTFLLERMVQTVNLSRQAQEPKLSGEDAFALSHSLMQRGESRRAVALLQHAIQTLAGHALQAEAFARLALWYKRQGDWSNAVRLWEEWLSTTQEDSPVPYVELAKYHEWHSKDLAQAEMYTRWALHVRVSFRGKGGPQIQEAALQHRLQRVQRKRAVQANRNSE